MWENGYLFKNHERSANSPHLSGVTSSEKTGCILFYGNPTDDNQPCQPDFRKASSIREAIFLV